MFTFTPDTIKKARISICNKCPYSKKNKMVGLTCGKFGIKTDKTCGCVVLAKAQFLNQNCPQNKW